jgi:uncharacterized membrane protein YfcA
MGRNLLRLTAYCVLVVSGALIIWTSRLYFLDPIRIHFLTERPTLAADRLWRGLLAIHVAGGVGCLVSLLVASLTAWSSRWKRTHRWSGRVYAVAVLILLCPTGFFLSAYAKGGFAGKLGFFLLCVLTFAFTWRGTRFAIEQKFVEHRKWMTRSMAMVASAMTFRLFQMLLAQFQITPDANYIVSLYASTFGNWLVAECWLGTRFSLVFSNFFQTKPSSLLETKS